jgi:hypothetical protein
MEAVVLRDMEMKQAVNVPLDLEETHASMMIPTNYFAQKVLAQMVEPALKDLALTPFAVVWLGTQVITVQKMIRPNCSVRIILVSMVELALNLLGHSQSASV